MEQRADEESFQGAPESTDEFIMGRIQGGDQQALGTLYDRHARLMFFWEGYSLREISERHKETHGTRTLSGHSG